MKQKTAIIVIEQSLLLIITVTVTVCGIYHRLITGHEHIRGKCNILSQNLNVRWPS